jgi:hypothetical protein
MTVDNIRVNGLTTKCMDPVYTHGVTGESTKVNTNTIKNMGMELISGRTAENTSANGKMVSVMARVGSYTLTDQS